MDTQVALVVVSSMSVLLVILLGIAIFFLSRRAKAPRRIRHLASFGKSRKAKSRPLFNPLKGVAFHEFLSPERASEKISSNVVNWIEGNLGKSGVVALKLAASKDVEKVVSASFSTETLQVIADGRLKSVPGKLGEALSTGRFIETASTLAPAVILQASAVLPIVIGCVQLIAGLDKAGPMKEMEEKVDKLLQLRSLDRLSSLQAVFEELKGELSSLDCGEAHLKTLRFKLKEIRCTLQNEIRLHLLQMKPPLPKAFLWWRWGVGKKRAALQTEILMQLSYLRELQVAIELEQIIWISIGQSPMFIDEIAPDISEQLKELGQLFEERIGWLKGLEGEELANLNELPSQMAELLEVKIEPQKTKQRSGLGSRLSRLRRAA